MSRTLQYYYRRKQAGLCVNCGVLKQPGDGVLCLKCATVRWQKWRPGSAGRPPLRVKLPRCYVCESRSASDGHTCAVCKSRVKRLKGWKGLPALKRILTLV